MQTLTKQIQLESQCEFLWMALDGIEMQERWCIRSEADVVSMSERRECDCLATF
jgi:hypothetical protein